jgi:uncharacterized membrane protein
MLLLILGLVLLVGAHSVRIVAEPWRQRQIERLGKYGWMGIHALVSLAGLALIVRGYGMTRLEEAVYLWTPPIWTRHLAALLVLPAFVLLAAACVPGNRIRARLHHPLILGVKLWAFAHLIANGRLGDLVLFGTLLAWAVLAFRAARRRDLAHAVGPAPGSIGRDGAVLAAGVLAWYAFARWLHLPLFGAPVF